MTRRILLLGTENYQKIRTLLELLKDPLGMYNIWGRLGSIREGTMGCGYCSPKPSRRSCNRHAFINDTFADFISLESTRLLPHGITKYLSTHAIKLRKPSPYTVSYRPVRGLLESNELWRSVSM